MTTITASDLKQNSMRLQDALREDLLVTKRGEPFVVVVDYQKYKQIAERLAALEEEPVDDGYPSISFDEACGRVADAVDRYRSAKTKTVSMDEMRAKLKARRS